MEEWTIRAGEAGKRLDAFLMERKGWSRSFFMKALRTKKIKVNGKKEEPSYRLKEGDRLRSFVLEEKRPLPLPNLPLRTKPSPFMSAFLPFPMEKS